MSYLGYSGRMQALVCVDGEYTTFTGKNINDILIHWNRSIGYSLEVAYNMHALFRDGRRVGYVTYVFVVERD